MRYAVTIFSALNMNSSLSAVMTLLETMLQQVHTRKHVMMLILLQTVQVVLQLILPQVCVKQNLLSVTEQ